MLSVGSAKSRESPRRSRNETTLLFQPLIRATVSTVTESNYGAEMGKCGNYNTGLLGVENTENTEENTEITVPDLEDWAKK